MQALNAEKILAEFESLCRADAIHNSGMSWRISGIIAGIHEGKYDLASSDIEVIPIAEKLDEIKNIVDSIKSRFT